MDQSRRQTATIGITSYAQESLGDIVFVDLPKVGAELAAGKTFGSRRIRQGRFRSLRACIRHCDRDQRRLATAPEKINKDAHGSWMIKDHSEES